jgi:hypothetical protein
MAQHQATSRKMRIDFDLFHRHQLHSGSKHGPIVTNPAQVRAIAWHQSHKAPAPAAAIGKKRAPKRRPAGSRKRK